MSFTDELRTLVRAKYPVIWIATHEERRALDAIEEIAAHPNPDSPDAKAKSVFIWAASRGITRPDGETEDPEAVDPGAALMWFMKRRTTPTILVMQDLHKFLGERDVSAYRFLRDAANAARDSPSTILVTSPVTSLPTELIKDVTVIDMPLPTAAELRVVLDRTILGFPKGKVHIPTNGELERVLRAGLGLTEREFESAIVESAVRRHDITSEVITATKSQTLRKAGVDFFDSPTGLGSVGGLENLKEWILGRALTFTDKAAAYGLRPPKGLFLTGPPGTGKTMSAKAAANTLGVPLLRVNAAAIFDKFVGGSEQNLDRILKTADSVAPCVLMIDEVEKLLAGSRGSGGENDSGVTRRVFGSLLSWMQDHTTPVLVVATANDPLAIAPELLGRFDAVFFVDLPDDDARVDIVVLQIAKVAAARGWEGFVVDSPDSTLLVVEATRDFSGREIERAFNEAMFLGYARNRDPGYDDFTNACHRIVPLAVSRRGEIETMRAWAKENATEASTPKVVSRRTATRRAMTPEL